MKKLTPFLIILWLMLTVGIAAAGAQEGPTADAPLTLFPAYLQTPLGQPVELEAETYPAGKKLTWISLDPSVAAVDADGCVTPVAVGETYIVCALSDDAAISEACGVRVTEGGNIFFWEYTPEPQDLAAIIAEMERTDAEQEDELLGSQNVPWPDAWPEELPQMEGSVIFADGALESEYGLIVIVSAEGKDVVEAYASMLASMGFAKGRELANDNTYYAELNGKGYKTLLSYDGSEKNCTLMVSK